MTMNKRIYDLARQAAAVEGWGTQVWQTTFTDKFAELLIEEIASIDFRHKIGLSREDDYEIVKVIKEHFGAKQ